MLVTTPTCHQCRFAAADLRGRGIPFEVVDITAAEHTAVAEQVKALGYRQAPVMLVPRELRSERVPAHWSGVRPDLHSELQKAVIDDPFSRSRDHFPATADSGAGGPAPTIHRGTPAWHR